MGKFQRKNLDHPPNYASLSRKTDNSTPPFGGLQKPNQAISNKMFTQRQKTIRKIFDNFSIYVEH